MISSDQSTLAHSIAKQYKTCVFLSPHLDDAVFSAGDLLLTLNALGVKCVVVSFFTAVHTHRPTLSARAFLSQSSQPDPDRLFADRRSEDLAIFARRHITALHYPFTDAMWRLKPHPGILDRTLGSLLAEFLHLYPTYRLHVAKGYIHPDDPAPTTVMNAINELEHTYPKALFLAPIGTGQHTDHLIVRNATLLSKVQALFWNDYPYSLHSNPDHSFIQNHALRTTSFLQSWDEKRKCILEYKTQVSAIFSKGVPVTGEETFYLPPAIDKLMASTR